jgi:DNA adenine methylase
LRIIKSLDTSDTFFYLNPPYVGSYQGHYDGYTREDFDNLLALLAAIKGKFLSSSYRNKSLAQYSAKRRWGTLEFHMNCPMTAHGTRAPKQKVEVLTANYPVGNGGKSG